MEPGALCRALCECVLEAVGRGGRVSGFLGDTVGIGELKKPST